MTGPRVLITGGAGFFGTHLAGALLNKGLGVTILDRNEIEDRRLRATAGFVKGDIRDKDAAAKAAEGVDYIFHNAAIVPAARATKNEYFEVNAGGTENILRAADAGGVKRFIFISSSSVYGIPKELPITESSPFAPVCEYSRSKVAAEGICNKYRQKGLQITVIRPRTIVGKKRLGIFHILFNWISDRKNIYIIGDGKNRIQFLSQKDLIDACIRAMDSENSNTDFNLGSADFGEIGEDLKELIEYAGSPSKIRHIPPGFAECALSLLDKLNLSPLSALHYKTGHKSVYCDTAKARRLLGWSAEIGNTEMLKEAYAWYTENKEELDKATGTTHTKGARQRLLYLLKRLS